MARFAAGKYAYGVSDRSGFRYRLKDMRKEWNGLLVGRDEYEPKHPQLEPVPHVVDAEALRNARPEQNLTQQRDIQYGFAPVGFPTADYLPQSTLEGLGQVGSVTIGGTVADSGSSDSGDSGGGDSGGGDSGGGY